MERTRATADNRASSPELGGWRPWYQGLRERIDTALGRHLDELKASFSPHSRLGAAVQYSMALGGKRLRPVLVVECCRVCGGREETALPAAIAVECIHTFSLIHDDLPAMDDDELRRGQPCNHKVFGEAQAILAGDWLAVHPFALLTAAYPAELAATLVQTLATASLGMVEGQGADVDGEGRTADAELVEFIHRHKTARLIEAPCRMGGLCAGAAAEALAALGRYGQHLGLAFQITDDLLDVTGSTQALGKRVGQDAAAAKQTYPAAYGIKPSRARAAEEAAAALEALAPFGPRAEHLRDLARYVVRRDR